MRQRARGVQYRARKNRGRWRSHRSLLRYEKAGRLGLTIKQYSSEQIAHFEACEAQLEDVCLGRAFGPINVLPR